MPPRVVAITGASSGIGRATAILFARRGWRVGLIARSAETLDGARRDVVSEGGTAAVAEADVADSAALEAAAASVETTLGPIDVWINNAGVGVYGRFMDIPEDEFRRLTETNYFGTVNGTRVALRRMLPRRRGTIVQVLSAISYRGVPLQSPYSGSKFGLRGFTEAVRAELMHERSRVHLTMVHPPAVNTPFYNHATVHLEGPLRPPPPVYQPELVAEAIHLAATSRRREVKVGEQTVALTLGNTLAPALMDVLAGRFGVAPQIAGRNGPVPDPDPNLTRPGRITATHGPYDAESLGSSPQFWMSRNREAVGIGFGLIALAWLAGAAREALEVLALVLGGGNALGAYHGGVVEALATASVWPGWVAGASIGGVVAAMIAGNKPERRLEAVREFWRRAAIRDGGASWVPESMRKPFHFTSALQARILGRPRLYQPRLGELLGGDGNPGLYDRGPTRRTLEDLIDFDLLNAGPIRVSLLAVDVETGAEVAFDSARERLGLEHLMASSALIPDFPVVEIGGRALADGGLAANVPADLVLAQPISETLACFVADPFPIAAPRPRRLGDAAERQTDLAFACQTMRTLRAMRQLWEPRSNPPGSVYAMWYAYQEGEVALKSYDFAQTSLDRRWSSGRADMERALALWRARPPEAPGLTIHDTSGIVERI